MDLTSDIPTPFPPLSSPTLTCTLDLSAINIAGFGVLGLTGPRSPVPPIPQPLDGSEPSLEITAPLGSINVGSGEGEYTCSFQIIPIELGQPFITNAPAIGSETIDIEVVGRYW